MCPVMLPPMQSGKGRPADFDNGLKKYKYPWEVIGQITPMRGLIQLFYFWKKPVEPFISKLKKIRMHSAFAKLIEKLQMQNLGILMDSKMNIHVHLMFAFPQTENTKFLYQLHQEKCP